MGNKASSTKRASREPETRPDKPVKAGSRALPPPPTTGAKAEKGPRAGVESKKGAKAGAGAPIPKKGGGGAPTGEEPAPPAPPGDSGRPRAEEAAPAAAAQAATAVAGTDDLERKELAIKVAVSRKIRELEEQEEGKGKARADANCKGGGGGTGIESAGCTEVVLQGESKSTAAEAIRVRNALYAGGVPGGVGQELLKSGGDKMQGYDAAATAEEARARPGSVPPPLIAPQPPRNFKCKV